MRLKAQLCGGNVTESELVASKKGPSGEAEDVVTSSDPLPLPARASESQSRVSFTNRLNWVEFPEEIC